MAPSTFSTTVHPYESPTPHSCAYEVGLPGAKNAVVFIGGLGDGPHTVPYARAVARELEQRRPELSFSVFEIRMRSSFLGYGFSHLGNDVDDISALVRYLRGIGRQKVVLLGHSTGCQDILEYTSPAHPDAAPVDGFILQAPVSDRGAMAMDMGQQVLDASVKKAKELIDAGRGQERMVAEGLPDSSFLASVPISVSRWYSLTAPDGGDNYFSPDLPDEVAGPYWNRISKPLLILHSGEDEHVQADVDKEALVQHWKTLCKPSIASDLSGTIPGANHRVEPPESEKWLSQTVVKFLQGI